MKNLLRFLFMAVIWSACQPNDPASFGVEPQLSAYADQAPAAQKLFCNSVNCENPYSQEIYMYRPDGRLSRMDQLNQTASGKLEMSFYTEFTYSPAGQLTNKVRYGKLGGDARWVPYDESEYIYTDGLLTLERCYFNQHSPEQRVLTGQIEYVIRDGNKVEQKWYDAQHKLYNRVVNDYKNNTLVRETWYGASDNVIRRFEHRFAGNRRQISEYMPTSSELISLVEKSYDSQGRLSSEETKVINPLLCTMQAGTIRYVY
ncbi:hypothetical protein [Spirosoma sp. KNUC1025]|uniref:hypothetical protein n=1 Tax=Spirosoma sp. KNUC1025 TaxID=2894082 RepID=UPI00386E72EB|nr:hypothetical protein LN737_18700 [Spirosoma sp. KNUC1025]